MIQVGHNHEADISYQNDKIFNLKFAKLENRGPTFCRSLTKIRGGPRKVFGVSKLFSFVDAFVVYMFELATFGSEVPGFEFFMEATTHSERCASTTCPMVVLRGHPYGSRTLMVLNFSSCVVLGSGQA